MEHEELLNQFKELVNQYAQHREFINKAKSQTEKFSPAIIEKVIGDHSAKAAVVAEDVLPLVPNLEAAIAGIDIERSTIEDSKSAANEEMEELQLRQAIGELSDGDFKSLSKDLKGQLEEADARLQVLGEDRDTLNLELQRWVDLAGESEQSDGTADSGGDSGEKSAAVGMTEDVSAVFEDASDGDEEEDVVVVASVEDDVSEDSSDGGAIEAGDAEDSEEVEVAAASIDDDSDGDDSDGDDSDADDADGDDSDGDDADADADADDADAGDAVEAEVEYGFDDEDQDDAVDIIAGDESGDAVELDLVGGDGGEEQAGDAAGEAEDADGSAAEGGDDEDARRALLLYQEGTAEEQIYPFTSEVLTIGRGRDNDIQIKNDSKVSRFHCKLFRRSSNFYIEDNKSSNGTLVNGELITERRLFGGEEVIIGETFFRFRIM